ncbi:MAG: hypothetical protein Terrestrivirus5_110 [Terrestrivirus sp.]|uniref:Uncharacterized protein n=1 Tax=Terrestrivirus sp. TaxID=2487775 RepID=A0A3G4ZN57_9VIRU|nr:MAG: hypothetical protein Terrestrivirus5_110 [Terrestrivirus sp.]
MIKLIVIVLIIICLLIIFVHPIENFIDNSEFSKFKKYPDFGGSLTKDEWYSYYPGLYDRKYIGNSSISMSDYPSYSGDFNYIGPGYVCPDCGVKNESQCGNCINCYWCQNDDGGECVSGSAMGPFDHDLKCNDWAY